MQTRDKQNVFDLALQAYGTLDQLVTLCADNDLRLDQLPPRKVDFKIQIGIGDKRVLKYASENNHIFSNEAIAENSYLLYTSDGVLIPSTNNRFIYI